MKWIQKKLADFFCCKCGLNRRALKLKRSWDEIAAILNYACAKRKCPRKKKKK